MNPSDAIAIMPLLILAGTPVVVMCAIAIGRNHRVATAISLAGLAATFGSLWLAEPLTPRRITPLIIIDAYALFYIGLIACATSAVVLFCYAYLEHGPERKEELYILVLIAALGASVLAASHHFVSLFLGLEVLSVSLYAMIAYPHWRRYSVEAALKYLILAAASAAFLLFGIALIYSELGTMEFERMAGAFGPGAGVSSAVLVPALALVITGVGFKLAVVPFHMWTPDVYEGAPAPVTAFIATVSKGAMFALLLRYFYPSGARASAAVSIIFAIIAIASMIAGNLLALHQNNVKRILAYSSIAHLGYLLVAFLAAGDLGASAVAFYLVAYFITMLGAFGVVGVVSGPRGDRGNIEEYRGLFWRRPVLAGVFTAMLFSLAGIPLTAGFIGKFYVVAAGASAALWTLIIVLVLASATGLYYYLRIVVALYSGIEESGGRQHVSFAPTAAVALTGLTLLLFALGVYPGPFISLIRTAMAGM